MSRAHLEPSAAAAERLTSGYEVSAIRYATVRTFRRRQFYDYERYNEPDSELELSCYLWVLRSKSRTIVVDTGIGGDVARRRGNSLLIPPVEALRQFGVEPLEVSDVILTHLHFDHVGNVEAFPNATFTLPRRELEFWTGPLARRLHFQWTVEDEEIGLIADAHRRGRVRLIDGTEEIFDGITAHCVGGHSPGQQITVVANPQGDVVLASDAIHFYEEMELDRPYIVAANLAEMYEAYDLLRHLAAKPGTSLLPGHDPLVMSRFPASRVALGGNAVTVV